VEMVDVQAPKAIGVDPVGFELASWSAVDQAVKVLPRRA